MNAIRIVSASMLVVGGLVLSACPSATPSPTVPTPPSDSSTTAATAPSPAPTASETTAATSSASMIVPVGKNVKSPMFSDDSCNQDTECAPVAMCHSNKCVALANVGTMKPGMMCTMDCRGGTVDCGFNHCGCADAPGGGKKCALLAGPKP